MGIRTSSADRCFDSPKINCDISPSPDIQLFRFHIINKMSNTRNIINGIIDTETIITTSIKILNSMLQKYSKSFAVSVEF